MTTPDELRTLLDRPEGRGVEFKSATCGFHFEALVKYCVAIANEGGAYTRRRGLDRETNKALLVRHIEDSTDAGTTLGELQQVLPNLSRDQVRTLLRELKRAGRVEVRGTTKAGRWFLAGPKPNPTQ